MESTVPRLLYRADEVCEMLAISRPTLQKEMAEGRLTPVRIGSAVRFTREEIDRYIKARSW